ncbi:uncharacterized protein IUM83_04789 [Phytophthora cinnamomi]|uniref:uncharacterized protein n=1 Tax=Phytophthora cinnamomi TaxID=4785 RepID=UPI0035596DD3|nr:hypothetical protein IUM83_04789 [Phytophthora cinnamomi]
MVLLVSPLPCLIITVLSDVLPLDAPAEGIKANKMFQVRQFYSYVVMSFLCAQQFRTSVRALPYPNLNVVRDTVVVAALMAAVLYGFALWIGFPTPFSIVTAMPVWVVIITVAMAIEWLRPIQQNPGTGTMVLNTIKVWLCEVLLVVTYPPYYYVFTTLSKTGQMFFASLLPVIKLVMRNIFTLTVVHLSDEMPELAMSLRDVKEAVHRMDNVGRQLAHEEIYSNRDHGVPKSSTGVHLATCLERAEMMLLDQQEALQMHGAKSIRGPSTSQQNQLTETHAAKDQDFNIESPATMRHGAAGARIHPAPERPTRESEPKEITAISLQYVLEVRRLLYLTEFLVLINYVGVFIPLIFSIYMAAMNDAMFATMHLLALCFNHPGSKSSFSNLPRRVQIHNSNTTMAKFTFFAAILLAVATIQLAHADEPPHDFAPFNSAAEGSGFVNTTLEEKCCL